MNLDCDSVKFAVLATVSNPRFELNFLTASSRTTKLEVEKKYKDVLLNAAKKYTFEATGKVSIPPTTDTAHYYGFKVKGSSGNSATSSEIDVIKYLEDSSDKITMLPKYSLVRKVLDSTPVCNLQLMWKECSALRGKYILRLEHS